MLKDVKLGDTQFFLSKVINFAFREPPASGYQWLQSQQICCVFTLYLQAVNPRLRLAQSTQNFAPLAY